MHYYDRAKAIVTLSKQAFGHYKYQIILLTILGFVSGILEGVGVNALIPLFSFAFGGEGQVNNVISQYIEKFFAIFNLDLTVSYLLIFIAVLFVLKTIVLIVLNLISFQITADYEEKLKNRLLGKILTARWPYLMKLKSGYLETIMLQDIPASAGLLQQISQILTIAAELLIYVFVAINISPQITLTTFVLGGLLFFFTKPLFFRIKKIAYERNLLAKETSHMVSENIQGIKTVKAFEVASGVKEKASEYFGRMKKFTIRTNFLKNLINSFVEPIGVIYIVVAFAIFYRQPSFNVAAFMVIVYLIQRIFLYIQRMQGIVHRLNTDVPYLRTLLSYEKDAEVNQEIDAGNKPFVFRKSLIFRDVGFAYENAENDVLSKINFEIKKGEMVGLIGPSGVGKTTMVDLILRFLYPASGEILLDGREISQIDLSSWRNTIGYVSQDIFLSNDTIANNITFYDKSISKKDMIEAAKMANIYDFIVQSDAGFDTIVGERGQTLSAGQRQRIVIARVLARKPQLLILDEATSALDNESEMKIQESIHKLKRKITILVIAHRLSTILNTDRLISLDQGKIIEQGEPKALLSNKDSYFFKVYNLREI